MSRRRNLLILVGILAILTALTILTVLTGAVVAERVGGGEGAVGRGE